MLRFGKYKGKPLMEIANCDLQYVAWLINKVPDIERRLDYEDLNSLEKLTMPVEYMYNKYPNLKDFSDEKLEEILCNEGLLKSYGSGMDADGTTECTIRTLFGSIYRSSSSMSRNFVTGQSFALRTEVFTALDNFSKKDFKEYLAKKKGVQ